jgi:GNAT superfamily N-acetyltransferase
MTDPRIRPGTPADADTLLALVAGLADYEKLPPPDAAARDRLVRDAFGEHPRFRLLFAEVDGRAAGYALFFDTYSSFLARPTLFLEDLFVLPNYRGTGLGGALLRAVAAEAVRLDYGRMEWAVLNWNQLAIDFYQRLGAEMLTDWQVCRLSGDTLRAVAQR